MKQSPPKLLKYLLSKWAKPSLWESIEGDLNELFEMDLKKGYRKARLNYFFNALAFFRYHRLRKKENSKTLNNMALFQNYLKVSYRDLKRNKLFTSINLIGLISGMTVSLFMLQFVLFETSFDNFHEDKDRIYRVINDRYQNGALIQHGTITYPTIGPTMKEELPEVEAYTRMTYSTRNYVRYDEELFLSEMFIYADQHFLSFFSFELLEGDAGTGLDAPFEVVLTESFARKLIGSEESLRNLIGQTVHISAMDPMKVTGIVKDPPKNSHLQFELLVSYKTFVTLAGEGADNSWSWSDFYHYVKLKEGVDPGSLDPKLEAFGLDHFKQGEVSGGEERFFLQPLKEAHLNDSMEYEFGVVTNGKVVWLLLAVAVFILLIAWINYINLNTGKAIQRAKEVGIRKSVGALRSQITAQAIIETIMFNGIALAISILLVFFLQPALNQLLGLELGLDTLLHTSVWGLPFPLLFIGVLLLSSIIVAIYPALMINRFSTQDVLKGSFKLKGEITWLKKGMVVFQFCVAVVLITAAIAIGRQIDYMMNQELGIDTSKTLVVYGPTLTEWDSTYFSRFDHFKNELVSLSGVELVTNSNRVPGSNMGRIFRITSDADPEANELTSSFMSIDHDFSKLYGIRILAGRDLDPLDHNFNGGQVRNLLINESAVQHLKYASHDEAIGRTINFFDKDWTVVGVVNDFHQRSLHSKIEPIMLLPYQYISHDFSIKLSAEVTPALIESIESKYLKVFPGNYFDYFFLEDHMKGLYREDMKLSSVSTIFTFLSIIIAVFGLYGLVMITMLRKTKEIGVRKVLGASLNQLLINIGQEFMVLVLVAVLIGVPISYLALTEWKSSFAYTDDLGLGLIIWSSVLLIVISIVTILFQTRKITRNNPVESLRCE